MEIEDLKRRRTQLAADISELIAAFTRETKCAVERVELTHLHNDTTDLPVKTMVEIRITVP